MKKITIEIKRKRKKFDKEETEKTSRRGEKQNLMSEGI